MSVFNIIQGIVSLIDGAGNQIGSILDGSDYRLQVEAKAADGGAPQKVKLIDDADTVVVGVTPDGRLEVELAPAETPPGQVAFSGEISSTIGSNSTTNFGIPVGKTAVIQEFQAGCRGEGGKGARIRLLYDQAGGGPDQNIEIGRVYKVSDSGVVPMEFTATRASLSGDRIRIERSPSEGSTQEIWGRFFGYHEA